jgi:alkanesulfonate monooxygenase SsuD/methylene tetrahydromethanopterin reductase-like flavin-dependent oxidoreductase (luciferase family)
MTSATPAGGRRRLTVDRPIAVGLTPLETRRDVALHVATRAEQLGYSAFFLAEGWGLDASVLLTEIAIRTERISIGTGVLNVWGRSAASIAMLATSLAHVSGDRFQLGLGTGSPQLAEGLHDVAFHSPVARMETTARQVRRLLDGGRIVSTVGGGSRPLRLAVLPRTGIPILLAALGPRAIRLTGEVADGWYPFLMPVSAFKTGIGLLATGAARAGADRALPRICPALPAAVSPEPARARAMASWWIAFYLTSMGPLYRTTLQRLGFGAAVDDVIAANPTKGTADVPMSAQVLLDELTIWGDAESARTRLDHWYAEGADLPTIILPPNLSTAELDHMLESLRPT